MAGNSRKNCHQISIQDDMRHKIIESYRYFRETADQRDFQLNLQLFIRLFYDNFILVPNVYIEYRLFKPYFEIERTVHSVVAMCPPSIPPLNPPIILPNRTLSYIPPDYCISCTGRGFYEINGERFILERDIFPEYEWLCVGYISEYLIEDTNRENCFANQCEVGMDYMIYRRTDRNVGDFFTYFFFHPEQPEYLYVNVSFTVPGPVLSAQIDEDNSSDD